MAFGINDFLKLFSLIHVKQLWKRHKVYTKNKNKNLRIGLNCIIKDVEFGKNNFIGGQTFFGKSSLGDFSYIGAKSSIFMTKIGKFCSIASGVKIVLGSHPTHLISMHPAFYAINKAFDTFADKTYFQEYFDVEIGNDVWMGDGVIIPGGVRIGDGAIIAARAVVTKDVEPYSVVGGVPAKHIKYRFSEEKIKLLLEFKWWDKEESWLRKNYKKFHSENDFFDLIKKEL